MRNSQRPVLARRERIAGSLLSAALDGGATLRESGGVMSRRESLSNEDEIGYENTEDSK